MIATEFIAACACSTGARGRFGLKIVHTLCAELGGTYPWHCFRDVETSADAGIFSALRRVFSCTHTKTVIQTDSRVFPVATEFVAACASSAGARGRFGLNILLRSPTWNAIGARA